MILLTSYDVNTHFRKSEKVIKKVVKLHLRNVFTFLKCNFVRYLVDNGKVNFGYTLRSLIYTSHCFCCLISILLTYFIIILNNVQSNNKR